MDYSTRSILTGLTANFAYELTDNNRIQFQNFFVSAIYTLVDSSVEISREQAPLLTHLNRALGRAVPARLQRGPSVRAS